MMFAGSQRPLCHDTLGSPTVGVASPLVVYERLGRSSVAGSLLLSEASETATGGPQGPRES
jgi:hypothetical protein